jgi:hypothetical protein
VCRGLGDRIARVRGRGGQTQLQPAE